MHPDDLYSALEAVTPEAMQCILDDLDLTPQVTLDQLCLMVRRELSLSIQIGLDVSYRTNAGFFGATPRGPVHRKSNVHVQKELANVRQQALSLVQSISELSSEAKSVLRLNSQPQTITNGMQECRTDWDKIYTALQDICSLVDYMERTERTIVPQSPRWVEAEKQEQRIIHALYLSIAFEQAFDKTAAIVKWHDEVEGVWSLFFQAIMRLVFREEKVPSLEKVLDEARKRFRILQAPINI
ncbi:MAG: hypothetical protein WCY11_12800 [Novosphingobium sp.]